MTYSAGQQADPATSRMFRAALLLGCVLALAVCYGVATESLILGSFEGRWFYGYFEPFSVRPLGAALLVTGFSSALLLIARPGPGPREWPVVLLWVFAAAGMHALVRSLTPSSLESIFLSDAANSFHTVTRNYDLRTVLGDFADVRAEWPLHAQSNMPGKLVFLYALQAITTRPDVLPWLVVIVSNLGGALMYLFVRDLFDDRRVAFASLVLYLFVPARLLFFPLMNTVTPVVFLGCACLLLRWLQTRRPLYAVLLGIALYALVFFEPLPLVMGLLFAALAGRALWLGDISSRQLVTHVAAGALAFAITYAAMYLWFGFELLDAFRRVGAHAVEFNRSNERPYAIWILGNLREFAFGIGICQAVLFAAALADGLRGPGPRVPRLMRPVSILCVSLLAVLAVVDLIGVNRGEVIRLWIFLACLFQVPAAYVCARLHNNTALACVIAVSALQAALGTTMIGFVITE